MGDHIFTVQEKKFSIKDFFSKYHQIGSFLRIWLHLLKKSFFGQGIIKFISVTLLQVEIVSVIF